MSEEKHSLEASEAQKASPPTSSAPRRHRLGRKRTKSGMPQHVPWPVRALWRAASEEEKARAHKAAVTMLEAWLGKTPREEAAARIGVRPLRFWQLSQQAVAGMVAGLLKQPKARKGAAVGIVPPRVEIRSGSTHIYPVSRFTASSR